MKKNICIAVVSVAFAFGIISCNQTTKPETVNGTVLDASMNNIDYIQGTWVEPNPINAKEVQGFTLNQDGTAQSVNMATLVIDGWHLEGTSLYLDYKSIGNGVAFQGTDTLAIDKIDADSMVLSQNGTIVWRLGRDKENLTQKP